MNAHEKIGVGISFCPSGCVCLTFGIAAVHLSPRDFLSFAKAVSQAVVAMEESRYLESAIAHQAGRKPPN